MRVVVNYRSDTESVAAACREVEGRGGRRAVSLQGDIASIEQGRRLLEQVLAVFGRIDLWVNNAGVLSEVLLDILETTPATWHRVLATILRGPFFPTQAVARAMIDRRPAGIVDAPQIIFITSITSDTASLGRGESCVAQAGLSMVAHFFAVGLEVQEIFDDEVQLGLIAMEMTAPVREAYGHRTAEGISPMRRRGTVVDVGRAVAFLASGALPLSPGQVLHVGGGLHLLRPEKPRAGRARTGGETLRPGLSKGGW